MEKSSIERTTIKMGKFEVKVATNGKFYFVLKARNGQLLVQSEMYESKASCLKGIKSVKKCVPDAEVVDA